MKKWALVLCYLLLAGCTRSGGNEDVCKAEYDPLYTNFKGRYRTSVTHHLTDSNGKDQTASWDGVSLNIDQLGPSMGFDGITTLPHKDGYDFCSNTSKLVSSLGFGWYVNMEVRGEGSRMVAQFHISGQSIDAENTLFHTWESDWRFLLGEKLPDIVPTDSIIPEFTGEGPIDISRIIRNEDDVEAAAKAHFSKQSQ